MGDSMIGGPYFHMSGYNSASPFFYQNLNHFSAGRWESGEHWNGAVLALNGISATSIEEAMIVIHSFIKETASWYEVLDSKSELETDCVMTVPADKRQFALSHFEGKICHGFAQS